MKRIMVIGASVLAIEAARALREIGVVALSGEIHIVQEKPKIAEVKNTIPPYFGERKRKGKGEKKRAASQRFRKGWG